MVIELRVVQFWSEIILVISNRTRAARSFDFEITRMISDQIALHSVQLPLWIVLFSVQLLRHASDKSIEVIESCSTRPTIQQQFESSVIVSRFIAKQNPDQPSLAAVSPQAISSLAATSSTATKPAGLPAVDLQRKSFKCSRLYTFCVSRMKFLFQPSQWHLNDLIFFRKIETHFFRSIQVGRKISAEVSSFWSKGCYEG